MEYRIERDSMGEIKVPADKLWGAQTQRSFENFKIGTEKIPPEMVTVFAYLKKAAALTNKELGVVDGDRADAIVQACDDILAGKLDGNFPLAVWMTGSGTVNTSPKRLLNRSARSRVSSMCCFWSSPTGTMSV